VRAGWLFVLVGCASGSVGTVSEVDAGRDARVERLGSASSCAPVYGGAVCEFFCRRNPGDCAGRTIVQVPIGCPVSRTDCETFSFDPNVFSEDTWAYCCIAEPEEPLR
jgi:hypothetical protein